VLVGARSREERDEFRGQAEGGVDADVEAREF
jgi:hypothetical protein